MLSTLSFESLGEKLHPFLASLPLSILILACCSLCIGVVGRHNLAVAKWLVFSALLAVGAAYLSGDFGREAASKTFQVDGDLIAVHQGWAKSLLMVLIAASAVLFIEAGAVAGRAFLRSAAVVLVITALLLNLVTGFKGGELVFKYGAGVTATCPAPTAPAGING